MALNQRPVITDIDVKYKDYAIGGKMITAKVVVSDDVMRNKFSDEMARQAMRRALVEEIVSEMLQQKMVEITQYTNPIDFSSTIAARAYVAPNETVKLLRTIDNE